MSDEVHEKEVNLTSSRHFPRGCEARDMYLFLWMLAPFTEDGYLRPRAAPYITHNNCRPYHYPSTYELTLQANLTSPSWLSIKFTFILIYYVKFMSKPQPSQLHTV